MAHHVVGRLSAFGELRLGRDIVGGATALWRRGDEEWRIVPPGTAIHHAPLMPHETRAGERTLLALYCWRGDTTTEAVLTA